MKPKRIQKAEVTKKDLRMLEYFFKVCELEGRLVQRKSKHLFELEKKGLIEKAEFVIYGTPPGRFPVTVSGWKLTLKGHMTYCMNLTQ